MRVEPRAGHFVICRGQGSHRTYFAFLVDGLPSWTKRADFGRKYSTAAQAESDMRDVKERVLAAQRRKA